MTQRTRMYLAWLALLLVSLVGPGSLQGQIALEADPGRSVRTRADLEELLRYYEEALQSPAYSDGVKSTLRAQADRIQSRLTEGDFKLGDRIVLSVRGELSLPDTVPVQAGPMISLPLFGDVSLRGVLRSEAEARITEYLSSFIRDPVVTAEGLMRISVQGAVQQPGFYVVPADMLLSETLMVAGGPSPQAKIEDLRVERGIEPLMAGDELQEALRQGLSLDQLNMQAGDQLVVPQQGSGNLATLGLVVGLLTSVTFIIIQIAN